MLKLGKLLIPGLVVLLVALLAPMQARAGILAVYGDVNSMSANTAARNQLLVNLLGGGTAVVESKKNANFPNPSGISGFYGTLGGVSASVSNATVTSGLLSGVDLLFLNIGCCDISTNPYSAAEMSTMSAFLAGGGTIGLLAEPCCGGGLSDPETVMLNALLTALGSLIQAVDWINDFGIASMSSALGAGVVDYTPNTYTYFSGGTAVATREGRAVIAFEDVGSSVPEPATLALLGLALAGLGFSRRRKLH